MHIVEDLDGVNIIRALVQPGVCEMTLVSPKYSVDGAGFPAESFQISSIDGVKALHEVLGRMIEAVEELTAEVPE